MSQLKTPNVNLLGSTDILNASLGIPGLDLSGIGNIPGLGVMPNTQLGGLGIPMLGNMGLNAPQNPAPRGPNNNFTLIPGS